MKNIVDKEWLLENLSDPKVRIVDCRFSLAQPAKGREDYEAGHLPGAVFFDLNLDLSSSIGEHGGRHPLPEFAQFVQKLEKAGISQETILVAYDNGEGAFAARFWWLLNYLGHEKVYVLDGGFRDWVNTNYPITNDLPSYKKEKLTVAFKDEWLATIDDVREFVKNRPEDTVLIDSREAKRYLGLEEPIDKRAGHIPGAINKPFMEGLEAGRYKSAEEQKLRFPELSPSQQVIVYCGSGVTACPNFLVLKEAGFEHVKLYAGSYSDWISYNDHEIE